MERHDASSCKLFSQACIRTEGTPPWLSCKITYRTPLFLIHANIVHRRRQKKKVLAVTQNKPDSTVKYELSH